MSPLVETRILREFLHGLVDGLINDLEGKTGLLVPASAPPRTGGTKPRITLEQKGEEPHPAKVVPVVGSAPRKRGGRQARGDVLVGCGWRKKCPAVLLRLSGTVSERLGLGPARACDCQVEQVGKTLVVQPGRGLRAWKQPGGLQYLVRIATAHRWGSIEPHRSEVCAWHFDLEDRLVIQAPAWLPAAGQKAKGDSAATCKKLMDRTPALRCVACGKEATVECSRCQKLMCDTCWDPHVRTHWHADGKAKPFCVRDIREGMGGRA
jgi:hypothetical protein